MSYDNNNNKNIVLLRHKDACQKWLFEFGTQIQLFKMTNNAKLHRIDYKRPAIKKTSHSRKLFNWETDLDRV